MPNLKMSNCPVPVFSEDLVGVIGIEENVIVSAAVSHVTIDQLSMELETVCFEIPCFVASVDLSSSYCSNVNHHA